MVWIFWLSLAALAFTYVGYPILLAVIARLWARKSSVADDDNSSSPGVSVVLVARNEAERIATRLENLLGGDFAGELEIVLVCDGCDDDTAELAGQAGGDRLRVIELAESRGKAHGVNVGVEAAMGEIVVFGDARQRFDDSAIARLVEAFEDSNVGAASGSLEIESSVAGAGAGIDFYWKLEKFIRSAESRIDSCIGCTGAIYAIRRDLFEPMPEDTILDDVVVPMRIAAAGARVKFIDDALAFDPQKLAPDSERRRKTRTLAGNFQMMFRYPGWLMPWCNRLWWQVIAHKYLRLAGPLLLMLCLIASAWLMMAGNAIYATAVGGQVLLYLLAAAGLALPSCRWKLMAVPAGFMFLQWLCVRGFFEWLRRAMTSAGRDDGGRW